MLSRKPPSKAEKQWHDWLADQNCYLCAKPACLHHCEGSTAKHNKIHIGQWWVIPLCYEHHQGKYGIHHDRSLFAYQMKIPTRNRKEIEKIIFVRLAIRYGEIPEKIMFAVSDYKR